MSGRGRGGAATRAASAGVSQFSASAAAAGLAALAGKAAVASAYRAAIELQPGASWTHSVDLDGHFRLDEPNATRWDYGVGVRVAGVEMAIWIEPHPASSTSEVTKMLSKLKWLKWKLEQPAFAGLRDLRDAADRADRVAYRWLVRASGSIRIAPNSKEARLLAREGMDPPQRQVRLP